MVRPLSALVERSTVPRVRFVTYLRESAAINRRCESEAASYTTLAHLTSVLRVTACGRCVTQLWQDTREAVR